MNGISKGGNSQFVPREWVVDPRFVNGRLLKEFMTQRSLGTTGFV